MTIGERIKALRKARHCTLEDVANSLGISRANIHKYEKGIIGNIPPERIEQLARFFSVSPAYLMGWEDPPEDMNEKPKTDEARIVSAGMDSLPKEQRELILNMVTAMYPTHFKKGNDDNDTEL